MPTNIHRGIIFFELGFFRSHHGIQPWMDSILATHWVQQMQKIWRIGDLMLYVSVWCGLELNLVFFSTCTNHSSTQQGVKLYYLSVALGSRGDYNREYLDNIQTIVENLAAEGVYVVLDFHQDLFHRKYCGEGILNYSCTTPKSGAIWT